MSKISYAHQQGNNTLNKYCKEECLNCGKELKPHETGCGTCDACHTVIINDNVKVLINKNEQFEEYFKKKKNKNLFIL